MRVVASHVIPPGGYHLLLGRESVRFRRSLVERFWYGITGAIVAVLLLGGLIGWLSHRALLNDVNEISHTALAISKGNLSRRVATRGAIGRTRQPCANNQRHPRATRRTKRAARETESANTPSKQSTRSIVPMRILRVW